MPATNSVWKSLLHGVIALVLFAIPAVLAIHGSWQDLTIGGILNLIYLHLVVLK